MAWDISDSLSFKKCCVVTKSLTISGLNIKEKRGRGPYIKALDVCERGEKRTFLGSDG